MCIGGLLMFLGFPLLLMANAKNEPNLFQQRLGIVMVGVGVLFIVLNAL